MSESTAGNAACAAGIPCLSCREVISAGWKPGIQQVVRDWKLHLRVQDILRSQGVNPERVRERRPALYSLTERLREEVPAWLEPALTFRIYPVRGVSDTHFLLSDGLEIARWPLAEYVREASALIVVLFTVGAELDRRVQEFSGRRLSEGLVVDAAGNAAMAQLMHMATHVLRNMAVPSGSGKAGVLLQPGLPNWPLAEGQRDVFRLVDGSVIGVELRESGLMVPAKTCSGVIAVGADVTTPDEITPCEMCMMNKTCPYRGSVKE